MKLSRLKEALSYDYKTGLFRWKIRVSDNTHIGAIAGNTSVFGYRRIRLDKKLYWAHRLAWLYYYGKWPKHEIDHINGDKADNRIANLRDVTRKLNKQNIRKSPGTSSTGLLGAYPVYRKFTSRIAVDGVTYYLGMFKSAHAAHAAYIRAKRRLHPAGML